MKLGTFKSDEDKVMTKRQVAALLHGAHQMKTDREHPVPWAFDALLLMYLLGLRIGEVVRLRYSHVGKRDAKGTIRSVMVPTEKKMRGNARIDPMDALFEVPVLAHHDMLARAFDPRTRVGKLAVSEWLIPSPKRDGEHLSDRMIDYAFREARDRAGLPDAYSSHCLRHTASNEIVHHFLRNGRSVDEGKAWSRKFLRHSKRTFGSDVTDTYIHLGPRTVPEWVPLIESKVLALPMPLAPIGPSRFDPSRRFGRPTRA